MNSLEKKKKTEQEGWRVVSGAFLNRVIKIGRRRWHLSKDSKKVREVFKCVWKEGGSHAKALRGRKVTAWFWE